MSNKFKESNTQKLNIIFNGKYNKYQNEKKIGKGRFGDIFKVLDIIEKNFML